MARVVVLSSYVTQGHVGLRAILPALEAFGHDVVAVPTVLYSNHAGHVHHAGRIVSLAELNAMVEALEKNNALSKSAAVLTGYLPTSEHVHFACALIERIRKVAPDVLVICDPILGDEPKGLYVSESVAEALRKDLLPLASFLTPNFFEFSWLTGGSPQTYVECMERARALCNGSVLVSSVPFDPSVLATLLVEKEQVRLVRHPKLSTVPRGTGDLLSGLLTAHLALHGKANIVLGKIMGQLSAVITASRGLSDLQVHPLFSDLEKIPPLSVETLTEKGA